MSGDGPLSLVSTSSAHLDHLPHYNGGGTPVGRFYVNQAMDPEYTPPSQPARILFSIQDQNGNDVYNVYTMVEIYSASTGERLKAFPWTREDIGDFALYYTFQDIGNYQIVISIANDNPSGNYHNGIDPPRTILTSNLNCSCDRGVLNISVSRSFGNIFSSAVLSGIVGMIVVFGVVAALTYRSRIRSGVHLNAADKQVLKYSVMLFAIAAGIVHLAVFSEHGSLRLEYSIFLLVRRGHSAVLRHYVCPVDSCKPTRITGWSGTREGILQKDCNPQSFWTSRNLRIARIVYIFRCVTAATFSK